MSDAPGALTRPVTAEDAASGFTCGEPALDLFFARHAAANHARGLGTTFVLRGGNDGEPRVLGFYTLAMSSVPADGLRKSLGRDLPGYPTPVALLGRFGVHALAQGRGLGRRLLGDAMRRVLAAGNLVGCVGVVVDAKNASAVDFYRHFGFVAIDVSSWPQRLFLPLATLREAVGP